MIFVKDALFGNTVLVLSATPIGTITLRSKKWSRTISEGIFQSLNNMKWNKEARKQNSKCQRYDGFVLLKRHC